MSFGRRNHAVMGIHLRREGGVGLHHAADADAQNQERCQSIEPREASDSTQRLQALEAHLVLNDWPWQCTDRWRHCIWCSGFALRMYPAPVNLHDAPRIGHQVCRLGRRPINLCRFFGHCPPPAYVAKPSGQNCTVGKLAVAFWVYWRAKFFVVNRALRRYELMQEPLEERPMGQALASCDDARADCHRRLNRMSRQQVAPALSVFTLACRQVLGRNRPV